MIILDVGLGYGAHDDPAAELASLGAEITADGGPVVVVYVLGTGGDPQGFDAQCRAFVGAGCVVTETAARALLAWAWAARPARRSTHAPGPNLGTPDPGSAGTPTAGPERAPGRHACAGRDRVTCSAALASTSALPSGPPRSRRPPPPEGLTRFARVCLPTVPSGLRNDRGNRCDTILPGSCPACARWSIRYGILFGTGSLNSRCNAANSELYSSYPELNPDCT
ncbi:MAG: hypothetical protein ACRDST_12920 [Pseudonocardiaceae bacterium]